jgi:hypothetical protein
MRRAAVMREGQAGRRATASARGRTAQCVWFELSGYIAPADARHAERRGSWPSVARA